MTAPDLHETLAPSVMAELMFSYGIGTTAVRSDTGMAEQIARTLLLAQIRLFRAPDDFDAIRADLDSLWRGERPARFAA